MKIYKTPGVYVEEVSTLPPSVAEVSTAIPAFFGYTEKGPSIATKVNSLLEYTAAFGGPKPTAFIASTATNQTTGLPAVTAIDFAAPSAANPDRLLYYAVSHYFANGGGPSYLLSLCAYTPPVGEAAFLKGVDGVGRGGGAPAFV